MYSKKIFIIFCLYITLITALGGGEGGGSDGGSDGGYGYDSDGGYSDLSLKDAIFYILLSIVIVIGVFGPIHYFTVPSVGDTLGWSQSFEQKEGIYSTSGQLKVREFLIPPGVDLRHNVLRFGIPNYTPPVSYVKYPPKEITVRAIESMKEGDYFEITIREVNHNVALAIGVTPEHYPIYRYPGWHTDSIGYHGDDGHIYSQDSINRGTKKKQRCYGIEDTIGCGIHNSNIYFTKNGEIAKKTNTLLFNTSNKSLYPTISANGHCTIQVNLKSTPPHKLK